MKTMGIQPLFFDFESDFVATLKCVPMIVRYKLDSCGIKLKLHEWAKLSLIDKEVLAFMPCHTDEEIGKYASATAQLVKQYFGYEAGKLGPLSDSWNNITVVPQEVQQRAREWNCTALTLRNWMDINTLQRFALVKLSRSGHDGSNFPVAMKEFGILDARY